MAKQPVVSGLAVHGPFCEQTLLKVEGTCSVLNVYPERKKEGILVLMKNQQDPPIFCNLSSPLFDVKSASIVNPSEEVLKTLPVENGRVSIDVPSRSMLLVMIK